jgi:hypothetical protein
MYVQFPSHLVKNDAPSMLMMDRCVDTLKLPSTPPVTTSDSGLVNLTEVSPPLSSPDEIQDTEVLDLDADETPSDTSITMKSRVNASQPEPVRGSIELHEEETLSNHT